jgi:hypothetical protein
VSAILRRDIRQLILDVEEIQRRFDMLEQDQSVSGMQCQRNKSHLAELIDHLKQLEFDLSTIRLDCESLGRRYWKDRNLSLINSLHGSFATMDTLFSDLRKLRNTLGEVCINPSGLQRLVVDWARFKKSIEQVQKSVQHRQKRRKNRARFIARCRRHGSPLEVDSMHSAGRKAPHSREPSTFQYL